MAKIAVASTDGIYIDEHFGRAAFFWIYERTETGYEFVEARDAVAVRQHVREHNKSDFDRLIELLSDCEAVFVNRIGQGAADYLIKKGVRVFEASGRIELVFQQALERKIWD